MTLLQRYQQQVTDEVIKNDTQQLMAVNVLQEILDKFIRRDRKFRKLLEELQRKIRRKKKPTKGLYLWGGVGIGKTYLMDLFFDCLPVKRKLRLHFHQFMRMVHQDLQRLQGEKNPLKIVARHFSMRAEVICFDEIFVNDITDAMLLAGLLKALFERGVCIVATSNIQPDDLYKGGLQRSRFLPAIALIKQHMHVLHLSADKDYRLLTLEQEGVFFTPNTNTNKLLMQKCFTSLTHHLEVHNKPLTILDREIKTIQVAGDVVWFDFDVICNAPRSQNDYLEIAQLYSTVFISNVPQITADQVNRVLYFINLVDVFYDANVKLILLSDVPLQDIYKEGSKAFEFERTKSRLREMQSLEYLHREHFGGE